MWAECTTNDELIKAVISSITVIIQGLFIYTVCGNVNNMMYYYFAPLAVFGWWIVTVTFLQHHDEDTEVFDDEHWKFVDAAFQTIDRTYGSIIDNL